MNVSAITPARQVSSMSGTRMHLIEEYVRGLLSAFPPAATQGRVHDEVSPEHIFDILTQRDFCYLGRKKVSPYREQSLLLIADALRSRTPIPFSYDIGGGYHATHHVGGTLNFTVGLAELLLLRQISVFAQKVRTIYAPGVTFLLVIDNLCALFSNDIPVAQTHSYCTALKALILWWLRLIGQSLPVHKWRLAV